MSDEFNTPDAVPVAAQEGADSPIADVGEDATAALSESPAKVEKTPEQKRLAELAYEAREAKRQQKAETERREALERELEEFKAGKGKAPTADAFESYEEYLDARADWLVSQKLQEREKASAVEAKKAKALEETERKVARVQEVMGGGAESYKDFTATVEALNASMPDPDKFRGALDTTLESEKASDILYYLGKNPSVVAKLAAMSPLNQAREIGRLEEKFESKKLTAAPAPVTPLKGNGGRVTSDKPPTDPAEYRKWRAKQK